MQGILIVSHGEMAKGVVDTAKLLFGGEIKQLAYVCYTKDMMQRELDLALQKNYRQVDSGEGVILLTDIPGGICHKRAMLLLDEKTELIVGFNLPLLMELITRRIPENHVNINDLVNRGRESLFDVRYHADDLSRMVE